MKKSESVFNRRVGLLCATALAGVAFQTSAAQAQTTAYIDPSPQVVTRDDVNPDVSISAGGSLDDAVDVTGIGQMIVDQGGGFVGLCSGSLINPRTVIFAAHCVNSRPAEAYGSASGGTAISFGFRFDTLPWLRQWLGLDGGTLYETIEENFHYNVEQVWYDPRSLDLPQPFDFIHADVALATLDTPAQDVPLWAMLFTPIRGETHSVVAGYGAHGTGTPGANQGIDYRRRAAENMLSALASLDDRDEFLFGPADPFFFQSVYQNDFDDPDGGQDNYNGTTEFDFDLYDGTALPREGVTAGGDSGGPLIVDEEYDMDVVVGVLSGGSRFHEPQPFSSYGTSSFYQPLFLFWETIVANNPYVYASALPGNGKWSDPGHWVQNMDPAYQIDVDGGLVNALPGVAEGGVTGDTYKFGTVCFLDDCTEFVGDPYDVGTPNSIFVPGGPGSTDFVPDNVVADPSSGVNARYYDITLNAPGRTTLNGSRTIDKLAIGGAAELRIRNNGELTVLTDYTQAGGLLDLRGNGTLITGDALLLDGLISGNGTFDPTFLTVIRGFVAPGGSATGTLTVQGDLILSSGATTLFNIGSSSADQLAVTGDADNSGVASLGGTALFTSGAGGSPSDGDSYTIVTAAGGVDERFDNVVNGIGVLAPKLTYNPNNVVVTIEAGSFVEFIQSDDATVLAFAEALDTLRPGSYGQLSSLYGVVDLMQPDQLTATFRSLAPTVVNEAAALDDEQATVMLDVVSDRLSMLGTSRAGAGRLTVVGAPETVLMPFGQTSVAASSASQLSFANTITPNTRMVGQLPENMSGFVSGGYENAGASTAFTSADGERSSWHMSMGLEYEIADNVTFGTAAGYVSGISRLTGSEVRAETSQAAVYGNYGLGDGFYVGGLASYAHSRLGVQRGLNLSEGGSSLGGRSEATTFNVRGEIGINLEPIEGLTLTPRAAVEYASYNLGGFDEQGAQYAMNIDSVDLDRLEGRFGATLSGNRSLGGGWSMSPRMRADYVQVLATGANEYNVRFAAAPDLAIALPLTSTDTRWSEVQGGMRFTNGIFEFGAGVEASLGREDYRDTRAVADMTFRF